LRSLLVADSNGPVAAFNQEERNQIIREHSKKVYNLYELLSVAVWLRSYHRTFYASELATLLELRPTNVDRALTRLKELGLVGPGDMAELGERAVDGRIEPLKVIDPSDRRWEVFVNEAKIAIEIAAARVRPKTNESGNVSTQLPVHSFPALLATALAWSFLHAGHTVQHAMAVTVPVLALLTVGQWAVGSGWALRWTTDRASCAAIEQLIVKGSLMSHWPLWFLLALDNLAWAASWHGYQRPDAPTTRAEVAKWLEE